MGLSKVFLSCIFIISVTGCISKLAANLGIKFLENVPDGAIIYL